MRDIKSTILSIVFVLVSFVGFSQNDLIPEIDSLELKPYQLKKLGKLADKAGDYYSAIDYYLKYTEVKPSKTRYMFQVAELYREARDYEKAKEWYDKTYEQVPEQFPIAKYYSALMLIMTEGDHEGAKETMLEFKKEHKPAASDKYIKKMMKSQMLGCELAKELNEDPLKIIVTHLDTTINKAHVEFSPMVINDTTLVYGALKANEINFYSTDSTTGRPTRQFYVANKNFDDWTGQQPLTGPFNSETEDVGNGTFSPDGNRFYFTRCKAVKGKNLCAIYLSSKDSAGNWTEPVKLPEEVNHPEYTSTHPTIGTEPKYGYEVIYFASDREEKSKGGMDIWYSYYIPKKESWKSAKNAGSKLNTIGDEITPFYDMETKTLYFSSNGWPGIGGLDVFKTTGLMNKWNPPTNYGIPVNSTQDDLDFTLAKSQEEGFFVSNRPGGIALKSETCCDDMYHFYFTQYIKIFVGGKLFEAPEEKKTMVGAHDSTNVAMDSLTTDSLPKVELAENAVLKDATITLFLVDEESGEKMEIKKTHSNELGEYQLKLEQGNTYELVMSKEGYLKHEIPFSTVDIEKSDTFKLEDVQLKAIPKDPVVVKNIYYPFDKAHLTEQTKLVIDTTLYRVLTENPEIIVEISAHTDNKGSHKYNVSLSQKRAESVVKYLIEKGIDKKRMVAKGYGESHPIAPNENEDGSDNEDGRAKNRRTEFKVIGILEEASGVIYEE